MDRRLLIIAVCVLLIVSVIVIFKKCSPEKLSRPEYKISSQTIKEGDSITYSDFTKNARSVKWKFGDGEVSYTASGSHTYMQPNKYTIILEVTTNSGKLYDSVTVVVSPRLEEHPPANFEIQTSNPSPIAGEKVVFSCPTPGVARYQWRFDESGHIDTTSKATYLFSSPGTSRVNLHVIMNDKSEGTKFIDVTVKNKPLPAGTKPPPPKPTAEIENGIRKTLMEITDQAYNGDMPPSYNKMIQQYFCGNQTIFADINPGMHKDISSYCRWLIIHKGTKILTVKVTTDGDNCVKNLVITQK